jgi:hypothetical protein
MKTIPINKPACGNVRRLSDAFVDNELPSETRLDIIRHTSICPNCEAFIQDAVSVKLWLQSAVQRVEAPVHLCRSLSRLIHPATVN